MAKDDNPYTVCVTTVISHVAILPCLVMLLRRRWAYESCGILFGLITSSMYHFCEAFKISIFLDEGKWHRLDNICAISNFGCFFLHLCCLKDASRDLTLKFYALFIAMVLQEGHPWIVAYTLVPIASFALMPVLYHTFVTRRVPAYDFRAMVYGFGLLAAAFPFFILGLDDQHDPWRIYHGMWHLLAGFSAMYLWKINSQHPMFAEKYFEKQALP